MSDMSQKSNPEVEHLLRNAELRNELEPYLDDSITWIDRERMPVPVENDFLASMLAWERAPVVPIAEWFTPRMELPPADTLDDFALHEKLWETVQRFYDARIVLDFTDHLSDRELYNLVRRDILPSYEKKIASKDHYLHWDCSDAGNDDDVWLRYYASDEDRDHWAEDAAEVLPPHEDPPFPRRMPKDPM
ncbi:MAG: hypothetical protein QM811_22000 [Pirellulales bacterium]